MEVSNVPILRAMVTISSLSIPTKGMNPFFQSEEEMVTEMQTSLLPGLEGKRPEAVYFYGAGCAFDKVEQVRRAISRVLMLDADCIEVYSDMLAAARSVCGHEAGIACIMGTGSNSCFYNGEEIVANVSPLGFILGDEGSGAVLGKLLVGDLLKNQLNIVKITFTSGVNMASAEFDCHKDIDRCPWCGISLNEKGICPKCGYKK